MEEYVGWKNTSPSPCLRKKWGLAPNFCIESNVPERSQQPLVHEVVTDSGPICLCVQATLPEHATIQAVDFECGGDCYLASMLPSLAIRTRPYVPVGDSSAPNNKLLTTKGMSIDFFLCNRHDYMCVTTAQNLLRGVFKTGSEAVGPAARLGYY
jgi:hypothetical protein